MSVDELKTQGNAAVAARDFATAVDCYTKAIELAPDNYVLYSNRSAAYTSMGHFESALEDAEMTIKLKQDWPKGYSRKGAALTFMGDFKSAVAAYQEGLRIAPNDQALQHGLKEALAAARDPLTQIKMLFKSPNLVPKIATDPELRGFLADAQFVADLGELQNNPDLLEMKLQSNPKLLKVLKNIMGVEVRGAGEEEEEKKQPAARAQATPEPEPQPEPMELSEEDVKKQQALEEKDKGNAAYKEKRFDEAIKHYEAAFELDPTNMAFLTNMAAVMFEQGEYEKCREMCHKAVEVGHENHADFTLIAKAYARIGSSYEKEKNIEDAIKWLQKSLTEHRTKDVLNKVTKLEKELKEARERAYIDPEKAAEEKTRGNELFKKGSFPEAVKAYTEAIRRSPTDPVLYSNRAAAYMKLMQFPTALDDCNKCLELDPGFVKGHTRKGKCLFAMKEYARAMESFETVLEKDPENAEAKEGLQRTYMAMQMRNQALSDDQRAAEAMKDPEVQEIMADPVMRTILSQMQENPAAVKDHLKNPAVAKRLQKLINAGIVSIR